MNVNANIRIAKDVVDREEFPDITVRSYKVADVLLISQGESTIKLSVIQAMQLREALEQIYD